jgi:type VII secretion-associated serine protease mycosin
MNRQVSTWRKRTLAVAAACAVSALGAGLQAPAAHAETLRQMQWHVTAMRLADAWKISKGKGVAVAVIDSGVDRTTADLRGQVVGGRNFTGTKGSPFTDTEGHGTGMASLIAGTGVAGGGTGAIGVAPESKILSLKTTNVGDTQVGQTYHGPLLSQQLAEAIRYAADSPARIINISMGESKDELTGGAISRIQAAVDYARSKDKLIFAAVGNQGRNGSPLEYPAGSRGVVGVGAFGKDGKATAMSTKGPQVDLSGAGKDIAKACPADIGPHCVNRGSGTSDATALASGSAALVWSAHPGWTANQVLRVLIDTAGRPTSGNARNDYVGYGAVRPRVALQHPGNPGPAGVYPLAEHEGWGSPSPKPKAPGAQPSKAAAGPANGRNAAVKKSGGGDALPIAGAVAGGAVVLGGAAAFFFVRRRRAWN